MRERGVQYRRARKRGEECGMRERGRGGRSAVQGSEEEEGVWYKRARKRGKECGMRERGRGEGVWYKSEEGSELRVDERESM